MIGFNKLQIHVDSQLIVYADMISSGFSSMATMSGKKNDTYLSKSSSLVEKLFQAIFSPVKPYLGGIGKLLLLITFIEDSIRIIMQWPNQVRFMNVYRGFSYWISVCLLSSIVTTMIICSGLVLLFSSPTSRHPLLSRFGCYGLMLVMVTQAYAYGLWTDVVFILRNFSLLGGLVLLMAQNASLRFKRETFFGGLPALLDQSTSTYLPLAGRVLLTFLFLSLIFAGEFTWVRLLIAMFSLVAGLMVAAGFKAKSSASLLLAVLSISNILLNNWWVLSDHHPNRDFVKYDFFQTLSVMGGFLLLIQMGPGQLSVDEKSKRTLDYYSR